MSYNDLAILNLFPFRKKVLSHLKKKKKHFQSKAFDIHLCTARDRSTLERAAEALMVGACSSKTSHLSPQTQVQRLRFHEGFSDQSNSFCSV